MNDLTTHERPRHVLTFDDGQTRWEHWRWDWHSLQFVFEKDVLTASMDNRNQVEIRDAGLIERIRKTLRESRNDEHWSD